MTKGQLEKLIRDEFIDIFKTYTGRGPKKTTIKITKNYVVAEFNEILTQYENHLLDSENGLELVQYMRDNLSKISINEFTKRLEKVLEIEVVDVCYKNCIEKNSRYKLFILSENIEEKLNLYDIEK